MNLSEPRPKTIYINIDLLFDFYSVLFSAYRTYFAKSSISISDLKHCIEGRNLINGLNCLIQEVSKGLSIEQVREEVQPFIDISLKTIKPTISAYTLVQNLVNNGSVLRIFTNFEDEVIKYVKDAHKDWFDFEILKVESLADIRESMSQENKDNLVYMDSSYQSCITIKKEEEVDVVFISHSKRTLELFLKDETVKKTFENLKVIARESIEEVDWDRLGVMNNLKWPETSYFLKLDTQPQNLEYGVWQNVAKLEEPIELTSKIVHGFGRGGKKLGIPTANLDMTPEIEEKLVDLVNGVYYGWAEFIPSTEMKTGDINYNLKFPMVMSIGFNPYFNNKYKTAEAHIMSKFEHDFYSATLKVEVLGFVRNEADFIKFAHLIEAIHNDVQVTKDILGLGSQ